MTHRVASIVAAANSRLRTTAGKRFRRFVVAAVAALVASQTTLAACLGALHWSAGRSALTAWVAGAGTSYLVSRWAWERRGIPHPLKETIPFWLVAIGAAIVLTTTTKFANQRALAMGLSGTQRVMFDGAAYFVANCVTFVTRFLIFHYVLFADRRPHAALPARAPGIPAAGPTSGAGDQQAGGGEAANGTSGSNGRAAPPDGRQHGGEGKDVAAERAREGVAPAGL